MSLVVTEVLIEEQSFSLLMLFSSQSGSPGSDSESESDEEESEEAAGRLRLHSSSFPDASTLLCHSG